MKVEVFSAGINKDGEIVVIASGNAYYVVNGEMRMYEMFHIEYEGAFNLDEVPISERVTFLLENDEDQAWVYLTSPGFPSIMESLDDLAFSLEDYSGMEIRTYAELSGGLDEMIVFNSRPNYILLVELQINYQNPFGYDSFQDLGHTKN